MKLLIAIPALNEEESIGPVIERCLEAREHIIRHTPVDEVAITVTSDGSTDATVDRARRYADAIRLIVFQENRGYGAAIKEAWSQSDAELLGFMDADGTCNPRFFAELCQALIEKNADIALGARLSKASEMPLLRRIGNRIFAALLNLFSSRGVRDAASGMRVVRRACLPRLMPLPDGLHFTPAMSARAVLSDSVRIIEIDMPYREREGQSKLRVVRDGFRFLRVILESAFTYLPSRIFGPAGLLCLVFAAYLMFPAILYYAKHRRVLEWMIYRFVVSDLLGVTGCLLGCTAYLSRRIVAMTLSAGRPPSAGGRIIAAFFSSPLFWIVPAAFVTTGVLLVSPSVLELVRTGATYEHWSRFIVMSFCVLCAVVLIVTRMLDAALNLIATRMEHLKSH